MIEFFKIQIRPPSELAWPEDPFFSPCGWFVRVAENPVETASGRARFNHFEITANPWAAAVYSKHEARAILSVLIEQYSEAQLCPSTFADWVECQPAQS